MPRSGLVFFASIVLAAPVVRGADVALAPKTFDFADDGQWRQVEEPPAAGEPIQNPTLDRIEQLLAARRHRAAKDPIIRWVRANPAADDRDRGLFLLAEMYDGVGDKVRAYYHLDELMDYYPASRLYAPSLEKQYAIADRFLRGYRRSFLRMPILGMKDEGVEILFRIQERAPGSPIAERALLRTADHYFDDSQFDLAADAYAAYARAYPRSPETPRVRLQQAFSSLAQFRGLRFDATPVVDAKAQLEDIQAEYPDLAERENVADVLERIDGILAARVYQTADFYRRTDKPRAAAYNLRYLVENYPETAEATRARSDLERMPAWALELPAPVGGSTEEQQLETPAPPPELPSGPAPAPARPEAPSPIVPGSLTPPGT